jgi:AsmA protein
MVVSRRGRATLLGALVIVMVIAAGVVFGGGYFIERWANARKDEAVIDLQARLGRPVKAGRVEVSWFPGFTLETGDIEIGAAGAAEPGPALRVDRARLRVALTRALFSLGRRVHVKEASLSGVTANVVRAPDGTINWRQISDRLAGDRARKEPMSEATRERLRGLTVGHARIDDARVRFADLRRKATVEVSDLDLAVAGAGFHEPFTARLSAAVQGREKNLDVDARFAAAPRRDDQLAPPLLQRVALRMKPIELGPLVPFIPDAAGPLAELDEGKLAANLTVDLGAAAPGGQGPTTAKGDASLAGARIANGQRFDGALESDVVADARAGSVTVNKLRVALGEMVLTSAGKLLDLRGTPRFDDFTVASQGLDFDTLRRYYPRLDKATGLVLGGPFTIEAKASAAEGAQRFSARVDLTRASVAAPGKLDKPAGTRLVLETSGRAEGQTLRAERVSFAMGDAVVEGQGTLHPRAKGGRPFDASAEADPFALRPVLALLGPEAVEGMPDIHLGGKVRARGTLGRPDSMHVAVPAFTAASGSSRVTGSMTVDNLERPQVTLEGKAPFLDLDDFLPAREKEAAARPRAAGTEPAEREDSLLARAQGRAKLEVDRGRAAGINYEALKADVSLAEGRLRAHTLDVAAFGGKFAGAGSELPLVGEGQPFVAKGTVSALDVSALLGRFAPGSQVMRGLLTAQIDLAGRGLRPVDLQRTLTGTVSGSVAGAEFLPAAMLDPVVQSLSHAVKVPQLSTLLSQAEQRVAALRDHGLGNLTGTVRFADGTLEIAKPLEARASYGALKLGGKVRLDGRADLTGTVVVDPEVVSALLANRVAVTEPLPLELRITGPLRSPRITPATLEQPARVLATAFARAAVTDKLGVPPIPGTPGTPGTKPDVEKGVEQEVEKAKEAAGRRLRRIFPR